MIAKLGLAFVLAAAAGATASDSLPPPGSYGFNWLDPENAACRELTAKDVAALQQCTASDNAFGIELPSKACRVDDEVELIVYDTAGHCQQGLETMQANAP